ncbi:MAG: hypothetical protein JNK02_03245 [Planctomycetes bacterium]|nr:hypothetical protein [Planctomycetota bacterium]
MTPISETDQALAAAFVDGDLAEPERTVFELRLAAEPELAAHVEGLFATDELVRRHARRTGAALPRGARLRPFVLVLAAAAVVVAVLAIASLLDDAPARASVQVALRPSGESAAEWIALEPALGGLRPPGLDELRGPGESADADPRAFVDAARRLELRALDRPAAAETTAAFYSIALRLEAPCDVVIAAFPERGPPQLVWPAAGASARLEAGEHVLPSPSFHYVDDGRGPRVEYQRGFLVPLGSGRVVVLVGTRAARAEGLHASQRVALESPSAQASLLAAAGFETRQYVLREP